MSQTRLSSIEDNIKKNENTKQMKNRGKGDKNRQDLKLISNVWSRFQIGPKYFICFILVIYILIIS